MHETIQHESDNVIVNQRSSALTEFVLFVRLCEWLLHESLYLCGNLRKFNFFSVPLFSGARH